MEKVTLSFRKDSSETNDSKARQNVSFKFSKHTSKKLIGNKLNDVDDKDRELILSVEGKEIKGTIPKEKEKKLVIKPIHRNVWCHPNTQAESNSKNSIDELAVQELLKESAIQNEKWENREFCNVTITIPMVMQNKIPEGYETDERLNVQLRAEESKLNDYEDVPVDEFGTAILRGLGCNPGDPIGNKNQKAVKLVEAIVRSKGLGLGAGIKTSQKKDRSKDKEEELLLVRGAFVRILEGSHKGHFAEVEGLDETRVILSVSNKQHQKTMSLPLLYVETVSKKEYKKESKVLNRTAYDEYNREHASKHESHHNRSSTDHYHRENGSSHSSSKTSASHEESSSSHKSHKRRKHSPERHSTSSKKHHVEEEVKQKDPWLCPLLRVRFVDNKYKKGKFFNQKMIIEDVLTPNSCVCKTDDGMYLEDIYLDMLETVVPRSESSYVKVVLGKYKGQLGAILNRDKANCIATINFLSDRRKVVKIEYDSICEYVGDVSQYD